MIVVRWTENGELCREQFESHDDGRARVAQLRLAGVKDAVSVIDFDTRKARDRV